MMFCINDFSKIDCNSLSDDVHGWALFDVAPYDGVCCDPRCCQGLTAFTYSYLSSWGDVVVFACSVVCVCNAIQFYRAKLNRKEISMNAAYTLIPAGENGSFKVIKPKQEKMF